MAITFTRAVEVAAGDPITSTEFNALAAAFNDRLISGLGDGPWRIFYLLFSMFRQVRNPDESGFAWPSLGEFFEVYQHIAPTDGEWPTSAPGLPEGANLASPMNAFVFGAADFDLDDEATRANRLIAVVWEPEPFEAWEMAKAQRGAYDPATGGLASPAYTAAREHWRIRYSRRSPMANSYGGYQPTPEVSISGCEDTNEINYLYRFTRIDLTPSGSIEEGVVYLVRSGSVTYDGNTYAAGVSFTGVAGVTDFTDEGTVAENVTYPGSCTPGTIYSYDDHVAAISEVQWSYFVFLNDGTVDVYPKREWIEGPYIGEGVLQKRDGNMLARALNNFTREFRGSTAQREEVTYHLQHAFDFQRFYTSQYHLAPARGTETDGAITAEYPTAILSADAEPGVVVPWLPGGGTRAWASGFVLSGALLVTDGLQASVTVELVETGESETVLATMTATPGAPTALWLATTATTPASAQWRLASQLRFNGGSGTLRIECTELVEYRPQVHDAAIFLRVATASLTQTPDGSGTDENVAETVSELYHDHGCLVAINGGSVLPTDHVVNRNAVWDSLRRLSQCVRLVRRQELVGMELTDGKTVLYVRRFAFGLSGTTPADAWHGIGPDPERIPSGALVPGVTYRVRSGNIAYRDATYVAGQTFVAVDGFSEYSGGTELYEADGILATAQPRGYSNRWLLGIELKPYHPSDSSIWKPQAFTDYQPILDRCHFYSPEIGSNSKSLLMHMAFGNASGGNVLTPEGATGYRYAPLEVTYFGASNANAISCTPGDVPCEEARLAFYSSCRVYEPDLEIESVEWSSGTGNDEVLKVTLTGRIHHCDEAPSSFTSDTATWDTTALRDEPYRTHENALREYFVNQTLGTNCKFGVGDQGANASADLLPDNPYGACYPTIRLTKLIPEVYEDGNTVQNGTDTHFEHDPFALYDLYLRAMCEGYVDGVTSAEYACEHGTTSVFDYTYEALAYEAFGNRWFTTFDLNDRPDNPEGFGPLPNTEAKASIFNQYAKAINLLRTVRVMLPVTLEEYAVTTQRLDYIEMLAADGTPVPCNGTSEVYAHIPQINIPSPDLSTPVWVAHSGAALVSQAGPNGNCSGDLWEIEVDSVGVKLRQALDTDCENAIPESWRDQFEPQANFLVSTYQRRLRQTRGYTTNILDAETCVANVWDVGDGRWLIWDKTPWLEQTVCGMFGNTFLSPELDSSDVWWGFSGATDCPGGPEYRDEIEVLSVGTPMVTIELV